MNKPMFLQILFIVSITTVPSLVGAQTEDDLYWQKRAEEAWNHTLNSYEPDPEMVAAEINHHTNKHLNNVLEQVPQQEDNSTRRELRGKLRGSKCLALNPIDACWRCQPDWEKNRKRLADCNLGFGRNAIGGRNGKFYKVTDPSDDDVLNPKVGTLRHAVIQKEPLWIIFDRDMTITLKQELIMQGDKTIDGRGAKIHINDGAGIVVQFVKNVIIHGIHIHDTIECDGGMIRDATDHYGFRTKSDGDGISLFGATDVWIDHVSMWNCYDGLIDAVEASTGITISNSHFTDHNEVMLFGASDSTPKDEKMQITVAYNHFGKRLVQRMPRCRFGYIHVVNNDYTYWEMYAIGGSSHPTIISQGNRFIAPLDMMKKEITKRDYADEATWKSWQWRSEGDLMLNGAFFVQSGDPAFTGKHPELYDGIVAAPGTQVTWITKFAGALNCHVGKGC